VGGVQGGSKKLLLLKKQLLQKKLIPPMQKLPGTLKKRESAGHSISQKKGGQKSGWEKRLKV